MNKKAKIFFGVLLFIFIGMTFMGVFFQKIIENKFYDSMPDVVEEYADNVLNNCLESNYEFIKNGFVEEYIDTINEEEMNKIFALLEASGKVEGKNIVGYHLTNTNGVIYYSLVYEVKCSNNYLYYDVIIKNVEGELKTYGMHFKKNDVSLQNQSRFTFKDKGIFHYFVSIASILLLLFSIYTASISFGSDQKRSILWSIISLCGIGYFSFVWNTGGISYNILSVGFPVGGFGKSGSLASYFFKIRFPLGAILYWIIKHKSTKNNYTEIDEQMIDEFLSSSKNKEKESIDEIRI